MADRLYNIATVHSHMEINPQNIIWDDEEQIDPLSVAWEDEIAPQDFVPDNASIGPEIAPNIPQDPVEASQDPKMGHMEAYGRAGREGFTPEYDAKPKSIAFTLGQKTAQEGIKRPGEISKAARRSVPGMVAGFGRAIDYFGAEVENASEAHFRRVTMSGEAIDAPMAPPINGESMRAYGKKVAKKYDEMVQDPEIAPSEEFMGKPWYAPERLTATTIETAPLTVTAVGTGVLATIATKNPYVGAVLSGVIFGGTSAGQVFEEGERAGIPREEALMAARLAGAGEAALEFVPGMMFMKMLKGNKQLSKEALKGGFRELRRLSKVARGSAKIGLAEMLEEGAQTAKDNLIAQKYYDSERALLADVPESMAVGGIMGVGLGFGGATYNTAKKRAILNRIETDIKGLTDAVLDQDMRSAILTDLKGQLYEIENPATIENKEVDWDTQQTVEDAPISADQVDWTPTEEGGALIAPEPEPVETKEKIVPRGTSEMQASERREGEQIALEPGVERRGAEPTEEYADDEAYKQTRDLFQADIPYLDAASVHYEDRDVGIVSTAQEEEIEEVKDLELELVKIDEHNFAYARTKKEAEAFAKEYRKGLTNDELSKRLGYTDEEIDFLNKHSYNVHKNSIMKAISEGKKVNKKVLADYPDLELLYENYQTFRRNKKGAQEEALAKKAKKAKQIAEPKAPEKADIADLLVTLSDEDLVKAYDDYTEEANQRGDRSEEEYLKGSEPYTAEMRSRAKKAGYPGHWPIPGTDYAKKVSANREALRSKYPDIIEKIEEREKKPKTKAEINKARKAKGLPKTVVTDNSVQDHPQQAILEGDTITINMKVGRQKRGSYTIPVSEWEATLKEPNPASHKVKLVKKAAGYRVEADENDPSYVALMAQGERLVDSAVRAIEKAYIKIEGEGTKKPGKSVPKKDGLTKEEAKAELDKIEARREGRVEEEYKGVYAKDPNFEKAPTVDEGVMADDLNTLLIKLQNKGALKREQMNKGEQKELKVSLVSQNLIEEADHPGTYRITPRGDKYLMDVRRQEEEFVAKWETRYLQNYKEAALEHMAHAKKIPEWSRFTPEETAYWEKVLATPYHATNPKNEIKKIDVRLEALNGSDQAPASKKRSFKALIFKRDTISLLAKAPPKVAGLSLEDVQTLRVKKAKKVSKKQARADKSKELLASMTEDEAVQLVNDFKKAKAARNRAHSDPAKRYDKAILKPFDDKFFALSREVIETFNVQGDYKGRGTSHLDEQQMAERFQVDRARQLYRQATGPAKPKTKTEINKARAEVKGVQVEPTPAEIKETIEEAGKHDNMSMKEQKENLLAQIDKAIKKAVDGGITAKLRDRAGDWVFRVPGDGKFELPNDKKTLINFRKNVVRSFPSAPSKKKAPPKYPSMKAAGVKAKGLTQTMILQEGKEIGHTDGDIFLLGKPIVKPKSLKTDHTLQLKDAKALLEGGTGLIATDVEFVTQDEEGGEGISDQPIRPTYTGKKGKTAAKLTGEGTTNYMSQEHYLYILEHYPNAEFDLPGDRKNQGSIKVINKGKTVGAVMPIPWDKIGFESEAVQGGAGTGGAGTYADMGGYSKKVKHLAAIEFPEILQLAKELMDGKYPYVVQRLRAGGGAAKGVFYSQEGIGTGLIGLRADLFKDPISAAKTMAHEVGHLVDWLPDKTMKRGNILGHVASLNGYLKHLLKEYPGSPHEILTEKERAKLRRKAAKEQKPGESAPVPAKGATPNEILAVWRDVEAKEKNPRLYEYIAKLSTKQKVEIVKSAMKDKVPEWVNFTNQAYNKGTEDTRELYQKLLREEIAKRGLFEKDVIKSELKALTQVWKPFNDMQNAAYTKYRYDNKELIADAVSVLINDPALLKQVAPKFRKAFLNYMESKPQFKDAYEAIQKLTDKGLAQAKRDTEIDEMLGEKGEEKYREAMKREPLNIWKTLKEDFINKNTGLIHKNNELKKKGVQVPYDKDPMYWVEELPYLSSEYFEVLRTIDNEIIGPAKKDGITTLDIGKYQFLMRAQTERSEMANPLGLIGKTPQDQLDYFREKIGEDKFAKIEAYAKRFQEIRKEKITSVLRESGVYNEELIKLMEDAEHYVTFDVQEYIEKRFGRNVSGQIHRQIGTLKEITNPFVATIMKDASVLLAANTKIIKKKVVDFHKEYFSDDIRPADTRWNGQFKEIQPPKDPKLGLIAYLHRGKLVGYYVNKDIADTFNRDPFEADRITRTLEWMTAPLKEIFVGKNPFWMAWNVQRDMRAFAKQLPGASLPKAVKYMVKALPDTYQDVFKGTSTTDVSKMYTERMLVLNRHFMPIERAPETQLERIILNYGLSHPKEHSTFVKPLAWLYRAMDKPGRFSERMMKIASYKYLSDAQLEGGLYQTQLNRHLGGHTVEDAKRKAHLVRKRGGSPDFLAGGLWRRQYNTVFLFSNAGVQGISAAYEAAAENPASYAWKTAKYDVAPKLFMYMAATGLFGTAIKAVMDKIPERDKENYITIPLGTTSTGKAIYFVMPHGFQGQLLGGLMWDAMNARKAEDLMNIADYMGGGMPYSSLNPWIGVAFDWWQYVTGKNPYNAWSGRYVLPEQIYQAGGGRAFKVMMRHTWNNMGGSVVYRFRYEDVEQIKSELEKIYDYPISDAFMRRFIRVSDWGERKKYRDAKDKIRTERANEILDVKDILIKTVNGEKISAEESATLLQNQNLIKRNLKKYIVKQGGSAIAQELASARTEEEELAVIMEWLKMNPIKGD